MKKHLPTFLFLIFIIQIQTFAQDLSSKKIGGMVIDGSGQPIAGAIISEIDTDNNIASNSNITQSDSLGVFVIEIPMNCMSLYVTSLGYKSKMTSLTDENDSPIEIMLAYSNTVTIDSVVVKGYRKAVTVKPDKIVYNMSATPIKEGNTLEAFRYIPLISADDNSFSIVGKNSTIVYINDRKTNMNSESLIAYLKSLPPDNIQTVDVIVNPGSTFRGEGNFGVINIKLKGYEFEGVKGNALVRVWKTHYWKESANLNLNVTRGKSMTNISTGIANYSSWKEGDVETNYLSSTLTTNKKSIYSSREPEFYANIQSDYQLNKNSVFGVAVNAYYSDVDVNESGLTTFDEKGADVVDKLIDMNVNADKKNLSLSANTNYRYNSDDGAQYAMVDFDYLHKNNRNNSFNVMNYLNSDMSVHSNYMNFTQAAPLLANVLSGKVEYGNKFEKVADVKLGIDTYYSNILNDNVYRNWDGSSYEQDDTKSNKFEIKESTSALFLQLDRNWMNKINVSLGARLEYTQYNGLQHATNEQFKTDDWHFLPSLNLNYMPSKSHSLTYNASYRISRPPFSYLNPFIQYTSPTSYSVGNLFLLQQNIFRNP